MSLASKTRNAVVADIVEKLVSARHRQHIGQGDNGGLNMGIVGVVARSRLCESVLCITLRYDTACDGYGAVVILGMESGWRP